jgi:hypothetical protein
MVQMRHVTYDSYTWWPGVDWSYKEGDFSHGAPLRIASTAISRPTIMTFFFLGQHSWDSCRSSDCPFIHPWMVTTLIYQCRLFFSILSPNEFRNACQTIGLNFFLQWLWLISKTLWMIKKMRLVLIFFKSGSWNFRFFLIGLFFGIKSTKIPRIMIQAWNSRKFLKVL